MLFDFRYGGADAGLVSYGAEDVDYAPVGAGDEGLELSGGSRACQGEDDGGWLEEELVDESQAETAAGAGDEVGCHVGLCAGRWM